MRKAARAGKALYEAHVRPLDAARLAGRRFLVFAGIGHPERFFETVAACGGTVVRQRAFPDHHVYAADELRDLAGAAASDALTLITTEKDAVRLTHGEAPEGFIDGMEVLAIEAEFDLPHASRAILDQAFATWRLKSGL